MNKKILLLATLLLWQTNLFPARKKGTGDKVKEARKMVGYNPMYSGLNKAIQDAKNTKYVVISAHGFGMTTPFFLPDLQEKLNNELTAIKDFKESFKYLRMQLTGLKEKLTDLKKRSDEAKISGDSKKKMELENQMTETQKRIDLSTNKLDQVKDYETTEFKEIQKIINIIKDNHGLRHRINFLFKDVKLMKAKEKKQLTKIIKHVWTINLGQTGDAKAILFPIVELYKSGYRGKIILFGYSRGAAACLKAIDMLMQPQNYTKTWKKFGYNLKKEENLKAIEEMKKMLQGSDVEHYLINPLLKVADVTAFKNPILKAGAMALTGYRTKTIEPIDILKNISETLETNPFRFYIMTSPTDKVVGNELDEEIQSLTTKVNLNAIKSNLKPLKFWKYKKVGKGHGGALDPAIQKFFSEEHDRKQTPKKRVITMDDYDDEKEKAFLDAQDDQEEEVESED